MFGMNNGYPNFGYDNMNNFQSPRKILMVSGYNGASAIQLGPNESVLALDESGMMIWAVKTDGAGYKSVIQAYDITPHQNTSPQDVIAQYEERIKRLEAQSERLNILGQKIGEMSNVTTYSASPANGAAATTATAVAAAKPVTIIS